MKRGDRIKLNFTRNWNLPGKERLSHWLKPSAALKANISNGIVWLNNEDIAIYTSANLLGLNFPSFPHGHWYFNPLAWQIWKIFFHETMSMAG